jgi:hypothetical protein
VRDIPLDAWTGMLKDPTNIFGRAFDIRDERSALSVMELFKQFELPDDYLPNGPVDLVAAVLPYIEDPLSRLSVETQLERFKADQVLYAETAEQKAAEWLQFDKELAESLFKGTATFEIRRFIAMFQHQWGDKDLALIQNHSLGDSQYLMTRELAARLEKAQQNILNNIAAIKTGNDAVLRQTDERTARALKETIEYIEVLRNSGVPPAELYRVSADLNRQIARQNFNVGGGCSGDNKGEFKVGPDGSDGNEADGSAESSADKKDWKWKTGVCQIDSCPSPKPTLVGPCSICRNCQHQFDKGLDPTKTVAANQKPRNATSHIDDLLRQISKDMESEPKPPKVAPEQAGRLALASSIL